MLFGIPVADNISYVHYRAAAAIYQGVPVAEGRPLPYFGAAGTGGIESPDFIAKRQGYRLFAIIKADCVDSEEIYAPYARLMEEVQIGFGRTLSHLPAVFGVSRQTLYNWLAGETPKEQHREKLVQLAEAARLFTESGFKPTALMLERTISGGKSFVELLSEGANGREIAQKLIRIVQRGMAARDKLDILLGDRKASLLEISDLGRQSFPDGA
jgi:hypothetical protein